MSVVNRCAGSNVTYAQMCLGMYERVGVMDTPAERLGGLVKQRRESLGIYAVANAAAQAGMSWETWAKAENGGSVRQDTYRKIEDVLQWEHGSCEAILDSGEPTLRNATDHAPEAPDNPYTDPEERAVWGLSLIPEARRRYLIEVLRAMRRATG